VTAITMDWFFCLMDFGDGGSSIGKMIGGNYERARIERIKGKYIPKAKYQGFSDLVEVMWFFKAILAIFVMNMRLLK